MAGLFLVFLTFEFTMVTSFTLCTEVIPQTRATMMAGYYAISGIGRMIGVLVAGFVWSWVGIQGVVCFSGGLTLVGLVALLWGLRGWSPLAPQATAPGEAEQL
jgi:MFS transporter, DHA1 family, inner membrane transport protein